LKKAANSNLKSELEYLSKSVESNWSEFAEFECLLRLKKLSKDYIDQVLNKEGQELLE
jgi:hypothetical protein